VSDSDGGSDCDGDSNLAVNRNRARRISWRCWLDESDSNSGSDSNSNSDSDSNSGSGSDRGSDMDVSEADVSVISEEASDMEADDVKPSLADPFSPQLDRAPGMPCCRNFQPCSCIDIKHFRAFDHPPAKTHADSHAGPRSHPYILIPQLEATGADMSFAREILGMLEKSTRFTYRDGEPQLLWPSQAGYGNIYGRSDMSANEWRAFVFSATHCVVPDCLHCGDASSAFAKLHETQAAQCDATAAKQAYDRTSARLVCAASANSEALAVKQTPKPEPEPRFLRVAKRTAKRHGTPAAESRVQRQQLLTEVLRVVRAEPRVHARWAGGTAKYKP
jgi:hypothetical protein